MEQGVDRLITVAATSIMSMTWTTPGKDKIGHRLQCDSADMAKRLCLYATDDSIAYGPRWVDFHDDNDRLAASATAWGSFNFQMQVTTASIALL